MLLIIVIICCVQSIDGEGLTEVFQWRQIQYHNDGRTPYTSSSSSSSAVNRNPDAFIFPDQLAASLQDRNPYNRPWAFATSRYQPFATRASWNVPENVDNTNAYIAYNNVPMGVTHFRGRLFITVPRRRVGIPSTLNYVDMRENGNNASPNLRAYPNQEINDLNADSARPRGQDNLISVYRTTVDSCKRLWFVDTGLLEYPGNLSQVQRPSIWIIDLVTDSIIRRFEIPLSVVETGQGLASISIDVTANRCDNAFAYIPDLVYNQLHVYSLSGNHIWSFTHNYFHFDPLAGDLSIGGQNFRWSDGIFSIAIGPQEATGSKMVFFHAMASNNEFTVSNHILQNETNAARSDHGGDFKHLGLRGSNRQSTMHEYDSRTGVLFYSEIHRNGVGCWNTRRNFSPQNQGTVAQNPLTMIYPSDLTIDDEGTMWVMTNSMPIFIYSNLDPNAVNFRVWKQNVFTAVQNTICQRA